MSGNPVFNMSEIEESEGVTVLSDAEEVDADKSMVELSSDEEGATQVVNPGTAEVKSEVGEGSGTANPAPAPDANGETQVVNGNGTNGILDGAEGESMEVDPNKPASPAPFDVNWRNTHPLTTDKLGFALVNKRLFHDAVFLVGDDKEEVTGHKAILAICSPVFEELFFGASADSEPKTEEVYAFQDQEPSAFRAMLKVPILSFHRMQCIS